MISKEGLTHHISAQFNAELEEVRSHLLAMGWLVEKQVNDAVTALIEADPESLKKAGQITMQAGMPAEVFIQGEERTVLQYLAEPITVLLNRAGRER